MKHFKSRVAALLGLVLAGCSTPATSQPPAPSSAPASAAALPAPRSAARWLVSTAEAPFADVVPPASEASGAPELAVHADKALHAIEGFGGAFNEQGWDVLELLPEAQRHAVLLALFERGTGLGFGYGRVPVGASDYALDRYTHDEAPGDFSMAKFSIERDQRLLIPFIQAARRIRPDLRLWASAWTPPTWMKTNGAFDGGTFKDDPKVYGAYALYLARFVEAYRGEGLDISMLVPQNEPSQITRYPSCGWTPAQYVTFIRDHLGPTLQSRGLKTQIFVGTINKPDWDVLSVLRAPGAAPFIGGAALQWGGLAQVEPVHAAFPSLPIMQSETECGNMSRLPNYNPETPPNDFAYAAYTFRKLRDFIGRGASSYMIWNMVLDEHGKNIDSARPWPQNAAIVVDRASKRVIYTPMYWVLRHYSALIEPGARVIETTSSHADQIAFQNPDGSLVIEILNESNALATLTVSARGERYPVQLPPQSFGSLVLPPG